MERKFFAYARSWWAQYLELSPAHTQRPVKLFALSELGTQRPVTAFVQPMRAERLIESPAQAAHFVALLAHTRDHAASSSVADVWRTLHSTLATRGGETEEHALLLCSLLLGFGLDAYVCLGADARGPHVWVLTRDGSGGLTFWESLSGQQYSVSAGEVRDAGFERSSALLATPHPLAHGGPHPHPASVRRTRTSSWRASSRTKPSSPTFSRAAPSTRSTSSWATAATGRRWTRSS